MGMKTFLQQMLPYLPEKIIKNIKSPNSVTMEITNVCNLQCRTCAMPHMKRKRGFMSFENFKKIIDKFPDEVKMITMNWSAEPLLNKDIFKMVKYATNRGIKTHISTNTTLLSKFDVNEINRSGLYSIAVCLDGLEKKSHENYRVGSDFYKIKKNIEEFCKRRDKRIKVILQMLVTKTNYSRTDEAMNFAKDLGVDELQLRFFSMAGSLRKGDREIIAKDFLPPEGEFSVYQKIDGEYKIIDEPKYCMSFLKPVILYNGDVTTCCYDVEGEEVYGNLLKENWKQIMRKLPAKKIIKKDLNICNLCEYSSRLNYKIVRFNHN